MSTSNEKIRFTVTDEHLKLVRRLHFQPGFYTDGCTGSLEIYPDVNAKRPLGNTGAVHDVCDELGWLDGEGSVPEDKITPALLLLAQIPVCLECFARSLEIRAGEFELERYGAWFHYKNVAMAVFWREAIEQCIRERLPAERAASFAANTPARNGNPYSLLEDMSPFFQAGGEPERMLRIFEDEAVRRYEAAHGNPGHDRRAVLSMLKSGTAGMSWDGFPF